MILTQKKSKHSGDLNLLPSLQKQLGDLFTNALPLGGHRLLVDSFVRLLNSRTTPFHSYSSSMI